MPLKTKEDELNRIEQRIEKLKERKKKIEQKMYVNTGKAVFKEWNIDDEGIASALIKKLKPHAEQLKGDIMKEIEALKHGEQP